MIHAFHAPALFLALTLGAGPASAVVTFDLTDTRAAELIAICEAEDGAPWTHSDSPAVVNCCIPGRTGAWSARPALQKTQPAACLLASRPSNLQSDRTGAGQLAVSLLAPGQRFAYMTPKPTQQAQAPWKTSSSLSTFFWLSA